MVERRKEDTRFGKGEWNYLKSRVKGRKGRGRGRSGKEEGLYLKGIYPFFLSLMLNMVSWYLHWIDIITKNDHPPLMWLTLLKAGVIANIQIKPERSWSCYSSILVSPLCSLLFFSQPEIILLVCLSVLEWKLSYIWQCTIGLRGTQNPKRFFLIGYNWKQLKITIINT